MNSNLMTVGRSGHSTPEMPKLNKPLNIFLKRMLDIVASCVLIVLFLPLMAVVAMAIMVQDGRPVFFGHRRVGRGGKSFSCWKFRTMVRDADEQLERLLASDAGLRQEWEETRKLKDDPRIIPGIGHFLRSTSMDELPQLFNVLIGEMSMVGPRPVVLEELDLYGASRAHYISVRPGLTGPWQIGDRNDDDYDQRVRKDVSYVENWTLGGDLRIILSTVRVPFERRGAY